MTKPNSSRNWRSGFLKNNYDASRKKIIADENIIGKTSIKKDIDDIWNIPLPIPDLKKRFNPIVIKPPSPDMIKKIADMRISQNGVAGEIRDIISEIADDYIATAEPNDGLRKVMDLVEKLLADPAAPEIAAKQNQRAQARHLTVSKAEGAALADTMLQGVKVIVRTMKPVHFK